MPEELHKQAQTNFESLQENISKTLYNIAT